MILWKKEILSYNLCNCLHQDNLHMYEASMKIFSSDVKTIEDQ